MQILSHQNEDKMKTLGISTDQMWENQTFSTEGAIYCVYFQKAML
jgi:hypothetical protein